MRKPKSEVSLVFEQHMRELGLSFYPEYKFHPDRKWRADFHVTNYGPVGHVLVEINGGVWIQGRHNRGAGSIADMEKQNEAIKLGFKPLVFTPQQVLSGEAKQFIKEFFGL